MKSNSSDSFEPIKHSLQSYEEEYIPGSWEGFLQQRRNSRRKLFLRIASGIAASLLIFLAGSTYYNFDRNRVAVTAETQVQSFHSTAPDTEQNTVSKAVTEQAGQASPVSAGKDEKNVLKVSASPKSTLAAARMQTVAPAAVPAAVPDSTPAFTAQASVSAAQKIRDIPDSARKSQDTANVISREFFRGTPSTAGNNASTETTRRKIRIGINFSPGISTAQASGSFNYTGGLSADIPLSSSFQLTTGLQVENQSIVKNVPGIVSSTNTPQNQEKTKVTNLDVPLNITWKFFSEKSKAYYVSAGLSSLVYLWENDKSTTYSQDLQPVSSLVAGQEILSYKVVNQVSVDQYTGTPDQTFDVAGRLNILVGFETKLSGRLLMHIEPYAKIPTSGQAPANLNHTSTGINFKISF